MELYDGFDSNYRYILVAARRARQIQGGAPAMVDTKSRKPCKVAREEIAAGKVKYMIGAAPDRSAAAEHADGLLERALTQK
jgi:DNA-directed RNA polymerase subunit omega